MTASFLPPPACAHDVPLRRVFAGLVRLACLLCIAALLASASSPAQPRPGQHKAPHHRRATQKPSTPEPAPPPEPAVPPKPNWPANAPPAPPAVSFNSQGLHIVADNSSLSSILDQVSTETGAKVEGLSGDERVFGDYGPGQPREVLADLLSGVNYNVLILGDEALGQPLKVMLSPRPTGPAPPSSAQPQEPEEEFQPEEQPYQPPYQPPVNRPPNQQPPFNNNQPMTPQQRMQMLQERQRQLQQQQQQQQQQPQ
jgi:hypothetical protein